jgi:hypothetical protein
MVISGPIPSSKQGKDFTQMHVLLLPMDERVMNEAFED